MKEFSILKIVDKFKGFYENLGVNYPVMRIILQNKLTMDGRRTTTFMMNNGSKQNEKKDKNQFYQTLWYYALIGIFICPLLLIEFNIMYQTSVIFIYFMFMVLTTFISDFSSVLLDLKDKNLISTKGVDKKTLNCAKFTHITIYIFYLTLALVGASLLVSMKYGIAFFLVFLLEILLIDILMISVTALAYFVILKFFDGEKLKDMINFIQIALSVGTIISYQIIPRLFSVVGVGIEYTPQAYHLLVPPFWFSAPLYMINTGTYNGMLIAMTALAVLVPILSMMLYIKKSNLFEKYLEKLNNASGKSKKAQLTNKLSKIFCKKGEERIFFNFSWRMMKGERNYKLRSYPSVAIGAVFPFVMLFITYENQGFVEWFKELKNTNMFITSYFFTLTIPNVLYMIKYSENYKGAFIYNITGVKNKNSINRGALKAVIAKLALPVWILITTLFIGIFTIKVIPQMIIVLLVTIGIMSLTQKLTWNSHPFSEEFKTTQNTGQIGVTLLTMAIVGGVGFFHFKMASSSIVVLGTIVVLTVLDYLLIEKL